MSRSSIAARRNKAATSQVPTPAVPAQTPAADPAPAQDSTPESAQSVSEADIVDTAGQGGDEAPEPEPPSRPSTDQPIAPEPGTEVLDPTVEPSLDEDPETSLVGSIYLHLLSEHGAYEALSLDDDEAISRHALLHDQGQCDHEVSDWRFRPLKALAVSIRSTEQSLALAAELTAAATVIDSDAVPRP